MNVLFGSFFRKRPVLTKLDKLGVESFSFYATLWIRTQLSSPRFFPNSHFRGFVVAKLAAGSRGHADEIRVKFFSEKSMKTETDNNRSQRKSRYYCVIELELSLVRRHRCRTRGLHKYSEKD
ncbi:hypothetical protein AVEN_138294-1 [Araneus ventricosus]|uniref:Uncharacterized protein n=1 Tax=Araneus ventricosus TaxID=182803 RepID=A0A4Y2G374_ARAVE|nr:hypothetical protein AVEN_138294-1 [Araneus ventricosus]